MKACENGKPEKENHYRCIGIKLSFYVVDNKIDETGQRRLSSAFADFLEEENHDTYLALFAIVTSSSFRPFIPLAGSGKGRAKVELLFKELRSIYAPQIIASLSEFMYGFLGIDLHAFTDNSTRDTIKKSRNSPVQVIRSGALSYSSITRLCNLLRERIVSTIALLPGLKRKKVLSTVLSFKTFFLFAIAIAIFMGINLMPFGKLRKSTKLSVSGVPELPISVEFLYMTADFYGKEGDIFPYVKSDLVSGRQSLYGYQASQIPRKSDMYNSSSILLRVPLDDFVASIVLESINSMQIMKEDLASQVIAARSQSLAMLASSTIPSLPIDAISALRHGGIKLDMVRKAIKDNESLIVAYDGSIVNTCYRKSLTPLVCVDGDNPALFQVNLSHEMARRGQNRTEIISAMFQGSSLARLRFDG